MLDRGFSITSLTIWFVTGQNGAQWFQDMLSIALREGYHPTPPPLDQSYKPLKIEGVEQTSVQHSRLKRTWIGHNYQFQVTPEHFPTILLKIISRTTCYNNKSPNMKP